MRKGLNEPYSNSEKLAILQKLGITPINGMIDSQQAALILTERAEIETGEVHIYKNDAIRWRVKSKDEKRKLKIAHTVNKRLNLFYVDDVFALELEPQKWYSRRRRRENIAPDEDPKAA